ncbi:NADP-dependent oxidoreductase [Lysinimonas soli]|uniref:NADP-dependent oxidoreductase n=1 Tax=Lysinimonas soli TaxID=1074233 RepID=A0ABW0NNT5_9MICO
MNLVVRFSRFGGPEVLELLDEPIVEPGPGQVRVALRAAGLNPADAKRREGGPQYPVALPTGIGRELAGVVEAVGPTAVDAVAQPGRPLAVGDEVFGTVPDGAFAQHLVADAGYFAPKPSALPWPVAGGLALVGQTAWDALASQQLTAGDTIVVSAAAGGVGGVLAQLAILRGVRVIGSASPANHAWLRSRGVEPVAYGPDLVAEVRALAPDGVTAAFDLHGEDAVRQFLELGIPPHRINTNATDPSRFGIRRVGRGATNLATLTALAELVVAGDVELPIEAEFPFDRVAEAFARLELGHLRGKIVIVSDAPPVPAMAADESRATLPGSV